MERFTRAERITVGDGVITMMGVTIFLFSRRILCLRKKKKRKREKLWGLDFSPSSVLQFSKIHRFASHSPPLLYVTNGRAISRSLGKMRVAVVQQFYETRVIDEFVLRGNTATLKCLVPSFVADFVDVIEWLAVEDGSTYSANSQEEKGTPSLSLSRLDYSRRYLARPR